MSWLVKADKPFTVRVSASPSAYRKGNITGETGTTDKTSSKHLAELPRLVNVALINVPELVINLACSLVANEACPLAIFYSSMTLFEL
ncbi:hypothetical protein FOXYSP1_13029 [Fusarium oxysporum f. sp. phaseoli]